MQQIEIHVYVPQTVAAREGFVRYGETYVIPTAEEWQATAPDMRGYLTRYLRGAATPPRLSLDGAPTWDSVLAAAAAERASTEAAEARRAAEREERIAKALAAPLGDWISYDRRVSCNGPSGLYLYEEERSDPRIVERKAEAERIALPPVLAAHAADQAVKDEQQRIREAADASYRALCAAYVREHVGEYARAAIEGCNVNAPAERHATETVEARLTAAGLTTVESHGTQDQPLPRALAYERLDAVRSVLTAEELPAPIRSAETRILRTDTSDDEDRVWRTAVEIILTWRDGRTTALYVHADSDHDDVDADSDHDDD